MNVNKPKEDFTRLLFIGLVFTAVILVAIGLYTVLESPRLAEAADETGKEAVSEGRRIYQEQCATCHGSQGEGGVGLPLNSKELLENTPDSVLFSIIRSGVPMTQMPAWSIDYGGPLTDQDVRHVVAFIRAWEPTAPLIQAEVFTPTAERGLLLFNTTCATCHGLDGLVGMDGKEREDKEQLMGLADADFRTAVLSGLPASGMPGYNGVLTTEQLDDLSALMEAWRQGETVIASYKITDEANAALYALDKGDAQSAELRLANAASVASGMAEQKLAEIREQVGKGNLANAHALLVSFIKQYPLGNASNGQTLYTQSCAACHGQAGEGGLGVKLNPNTFVKEQTNAQLLDFIQVGRPGTAMAGWQERLTDDEIADIIAFLRTWNP